MTPRTINILYLEAPQLNGIIGKERSSNTEIPSYIQGIPTQLGTVITTAHAPLHVARPEIPQLNRTERGVGGSEHWSDRGRGSLQGNEEM